MNEAPYNVVIVEDHRLFREGLKAMLASRDDIKVIAEAADGLEAVRMLQSTPPDIVLLDLSMPKMNGISVIKELRRLQPETRILCLTIHESDQYVLEAFEAGAIGYCIKDSSRQELMLALDSMIEGKHYISPAISDLLVEGYLDSRQAKQPDTEWDTITQREKEVLKMLAEGYSNKEISEFLHISVKTVEKHRSNLISKLDLHNVAQLTTFAMTKGLVELKT